MTRLYNTLTRRLEPLDPIVPGRIGLYVCGVTVYDLCHVGHARAFVVYDVLVRHLRASGYEVTFVRNITDIDDKIIQRAKEENIAAIELAERNIDEFHRDVAGLGCVLPDHEPRATRFVEEMQALTRQLLDRGIAYVVDGDVYFSVGDFEGYGKLSRRHLDELQAGARVEVDPRKRHPMDFALWKSVSDDRRAGGEPTWDSPWGPGRPGWHLECSAMSTRLLGQPFDLHGGGEDLVFPHHENEIAQSEGATGEPFVRHFLHHSFVRWNEEKMSKSLGNVFSIREIGRERPLEALRLFLLGTHYRSPMDFSTGGLEESYRALIRLYETLARSGRMAVPGGEAPKEFAEAMQDDLNTARALGIVFDGARDLNRSLDAKDDSAAAAIRSSLEPALDVLGIGRADPEAFLSSERRRSLSEAGMSEDAIDGAIRERMEARRNKDWSRADEIRDELAAKGILLEDGPAGTSWRPEAWG